MVSRKNGVARKDQSAASVAVTWIKKPYQFLTIGKSVKAPINISHDDALFKKQFCPNIKQLKYHCFQS